jgi:hypothetical protein
MAFWVTYAIAVHIAGMAFVLSLIAYLRARESRPQAVKDTVRGAVDIDGELAALCAQFYVAPRLALLEARLLLGIEDTADALSPQEEFLRLLKQLESGKRRRGGLLASREH